MQKINLTASKGKKPFIPTEDDDLPPFTPTKKPTVLEYLKSLNIATAETIERRKREAKEMVFVLPGIASRGQATVIYASPNSGKTLITLKLLRDQATAGELKDLTVVYCNMDDDFNGANFKAEYVKGLENIIMVDGQVTDPESVMDMMRESVEDGTAASLCFVLDTIIRFVSDSDKKTQRAFNALVQAFIAAQGTIIALGHMNKHKDGFGKSVHGGTSDIPNSFSQTARLELETAKDDTDRRVRFSNDKLRGICKTSTCYGYKHADERNWLERVATVERIDEQTASELRQASEAAKQREADQHIINSILSELATGAKAHTVLEKNNDLEGTRTQRGRVLRTYSEENANPGFRFWETSKGQKGGNNYYLA